MRPCVDEVQAAAWGDRTGERTVEDPCRLGLGARRGAAGQRSDGEHRDDRRGRDVPHTHPFGVKSRAVPDSATSP